MLIIIYMENYNDIMRSKFIIIYPVTSTQNKRVKDATSQAQSLVREKEGEKRQSNAKGKTSHAGTGELVGKINDTRAYQMVLQ